MCSKVPTFGLSGSVRWDLQAGHTLTTKSEKNLSFFQSLGRVEGKYSCSSGGRQQNNLSQAWAPKGGYRYRHRVQQGAVILIILRSRDLSPSCCAFRPTKWKESKKHSLFWSVLLPIHKLHVKFFLKDFCCTFIGNVALKGKHHFGEKGG